MTVVEDQGTGAAARPLAAATGGPLDAAACARTSALVLANLPLVAHAVRAAAARVPTHVNRDDLTSAGMLALVQAARGFDPSRGVPFAPFAARRIAGSLLDELRGMDWASRSVRRRDREVDGARNRLAAVLGRTPSADQIASATGLTRGELAAHAGDVARASVTSLHAMTGEAVDGLPGRRPVEPDAVLLHREQLAYLTDAVEALPDRLRTVVQGWFFEDRPMALIAAEFGVTESRVSQMRAEALVLLRHALDAVLHPAGQDAAAAPGTRVAGVPVGVGQRRRAEYVARVCAVRTVAERLAYVGDTELGLSA